MKKSRKAVLCLTLALAMSLSLFAGCSQQTVNSSKEETSSTSSETKATGKLTIMHYLVETGKLKALNDTVDGFKKLNPDCEVDVQGMSLDQYSNTLNMKISSGDMPDIVFGNPKTYSDVVKSGSILDITDKEYTKRVDSEALKCCEVDGKVYGIPMDLMLSGVIYNKDIFAKYNIEIPKTYDDFIKVCKTLKDNNVTAVAAGYKDLASCGGSYWCQFFGGALATEPTFRQDIMSGAKNPSDYPILKQFLTQWREINQYTNNATQVGVDRSEQEFASGKAAMLIIGSWGISAVRNYNQDGNFGSFLFPFFNDSSKNKMQYNTDDTWMLASHSSNLPAAEKFFDYMTTKEAAVTWATDVPAVSAITGADATGLDPILNDMNDVLKSGAAYNAQAETSFSGQSATVWDNQMQAWCFSNDDVDTFLKSVDKAMANARTTGN